MLSAVVGRTYNARKMSCRLSARLPVMHQCGDEQEMQRLKSNVTAETGRPSEVTFCKRVRNTIYLGIFGVLRLSLHSVILKRICCTICLKLEAFVNL